MEAAAQFTRADSRAVDLAVAGAVQRYSSSRVRGAVTWRGIWAINGLVGMILLSVDGRTVNAPITGVSWRIGEEGVFTELAAGFAEVS